MTVLQAVVLGAVQGLTEFLPVSSSGHLVLVHYFLGWGDQLPLWVDVATNTGTLLAVVFYLWRDVSSAVGGFFAGLASSQARSRPGWRLALLVLAGSVPTAVIGLALRGVFERLNAPLPVAIALAVTGLVLWLAPTSGPKREPRDLTFADALVAGVVQGVAVIPGISRSGSTIATLLARGADKELAPRVSFLLYLVASLGVAALGFRDVRDAAVPLAPLLAMVAASFAVGYLALVSVFAVLRRGRFRAFAPYLWAVSAVTIVAVLLGR